MTKASRPTVTATQTPRAATTSIPIHQLRYSLGDPRPYQPRLVYSVPIGGARTAEATVSATSFYIYSDSSRAGPIPARRPAGQLVSFDKPGSQSSRSRSRVSAAAGSRPPARARELAQVVTARNDKTRARRASLTHKGRISLRPAGGKLGIYARFAFRRVPMNVG